MREIFGRKIKSRGGAEYAEKNIQGFMKEINYVVDYISATSALAFMVSAGEIIIYI